MHKGPYRKRNLPVEDVQCRKHPLYNTWACMFARCEDKSNPSYRNYGARGIAVTRRCRCFDTFLSDMGPRPSVKHSLDRKNNDKNYCPSNCQWATRSEQMLNRRTFKTNTTGHRGVVKHGNGYDARINIDGTRHVIGYYKTFNEAAAARKKFDSAYAKNPAAAFNLIVTDAARHNSTTGVRGVTPHKDGGYTARITRAGKRIYLGYFKSLKDACDARTTALEG